MMPAELIVLFAVVAVLSGVQSGFFLHGLLRKQSRSMQSTGLITTVLLAVVMAAIEPSNEFVIGFLTAVPIGYFLALKKYRRENRFE